MERRENGHGLKRPPSMGEMKRQADAQALTLRAELRLAMQLRGLRLEDVARLARLDLDALATFLDGQSINPRWQEKLARWLESEPNA
jgi:hypothetical protein